MWIDQHSEYCFNEKMDSVKPISKPWIGWRLSKVQTHIPKQKQAHHYQQNTPNSNSETVNERKWFYIVCPVAFPFNFSWTPDVN